MFNHISKCVFFVIIISETVKATSEISDKRLCANVDCSEPISYAKSLLRYNSPHEKILSFGPNQDVTIYSKSAGKNMDLWGAEIKGKRGYVPKIYMRETKILIKNPEFEVDTELLQQNETVEKSEAHKSTPRPDPVQAAYEVVDGTTIYMDEAITPTTPDNSVKPTVTPDVNRHTKPLDEPEKVENFHDVEKKEDVKSDVDDSIVGNIISGLSDFLSKTAEEQDDDDEDGDGDENEEDEPDDGEIEVEDDDKEQIQQDSVNDSPQNSFDSTQEVISDADSAQETLSNMTQEPNSEPLQQNSDTILEVSPDSIQLPNTDSEEKDQKVPIDETGAETKADVIEETKEPSNYSNNFDSQPVVPDNSDENDKPIVESVNKSDMISEATNIEVEQQNTATNPIENTAQNETPIKTDAVDQLPIADLNNNDNGATNSAESTVQNEMPYKIDTNDQLPTANLNNNQQIDTSSSEILESTPSETNFVPENVPTTESTIHHDAPEDFFVENVTSDPGRAHSNEDSHEELYKNTLDVNNNVSPDDNEKSLDLQTESQTENVLENSDQITLEPTQKLDVVNDVVFESKVNANASENTNEKTIDEVDTEVTDESAKIGAHHDDVENNDNNEETTEAPTGKGEIVDPANENKEELDGNSESSGIFTSMYDRIFGNPKTNRAEEIDEIQKDLNNENLQSEFSRPSVQENSKDSSNDDKLMEDLINSKHQNFLVVTAITVLLFLLGYMFIDQNRKEAPLIAKINKLEKELLVKIKECADLTEKFSGNEGSFELEEASTELVQSLREELENSKTIQTALEEQVQTLEKELENSTEVGLELNRMLSEILNSQNASETLITNIEQLQKQLLEQQGVINSLNESLTVKNTENHELNLELDISNKKVIDLQAELDKMVLNLLKMEEEKEQQQNSLETEIVALKEQITKCDIESKLQVTNLNDELNSLRNKLGDVEKQLEIKTNEFNLLKESAREWNSVENKSETLKSLLEVNSIKAELQQVRHDNQILNEHLHREQEMKSAYEKQIEITMKEVQNLKAKYDEADKQKLEAQTKLEVLSTYFSEREAELQKELSKQEKMWTEKQGEANSTIERIKYMQEELQNCKAHNEALKQEIVSQEVELKSQITVLEKKAHENWLMARQAERRLEDAKQEAAQLRNRLTLRERTLNDDKVQNRVQTPLERDGDMSASPLHMNVESPASPPLLFGTQNHLTTSPPLPGLPPPFLPPPPGVPFMSNPLYSVPPFMPPHLPFPSDHRPAPLGRLSSPPPLNSRYSPDSRAYSPYDRNSPSPPYDSEYSPSSPNSPFRTYTHYNNRIDDRKEYIRPPPIRKSRNTKVSGTLSSGSGNSNESLEKINRHTSSKI